MAMAEDGWFEVEANGYRLMMTEQVNRFPTLGQLGSGSAGLLSLPIIQTLVVAGVDRGQMKQLEAGLTGEGVCIASGEVSDSTIVGLPSVALLPDLCG